MRMRCDEALPNAKAGSDRRLLHGKKLASYLSHGPWPVGCWPVSIFDRRPARQLTLNDDVHSYLRFLPSQTNRGNLLTPSDFSDKK